MVGLEITDEDTERCDLEKTLSHDTKEKRLKLI